MHDHQIGLERTLIVRPLRPSFDVTTILVSSIVSTVFFAAIAALV